ncbi:glycosyltransferase [Fibrobacter sp. UWEL]|uniref:glycosyltransferase n=1 Tax=Fibrobacter sp. UWEL TaxID=1896209 RepID=UPI00091CEB90|nr:glycosyltransferase [Fibrobacter sp. UWEL]SHL48582.1 Glycosyltransferase involved in cell wall bisynthesis [Fibrobacter sp. UWEL]
MNLKILYILSGSDFAGSTLSFLTIAENVKKRGDNPFVILPNHNIDLEIILRSRQIPYFIAPVHFFCYPQKFRGFWFLFDIRDIIVNEIRSFLAIKKIVSEIKPDIIHTNVGPVSIGHFISKYFKLPHIWHIREYGDLDFNLHPFPNKRFFHHCLSQDYPIAITKDIFNYNQLTNNKKASIVYNGVRSQDEICFNENKEHFFLCASRVSPEKGHKTVIKAFSVFSKDYDDYRLVILGEGSREYQEELLEFTRTLHCESKVEFKGFISNVSDYMKKATALIVASPAEGFGRMTAEAIFAGCIVLGKNSGGTKEILEEAGGFLFNSELELLESMKKVIQLKTCEYQNFIQNAQGIAKKLYSTENCIDMIYTVYRKALDNSHG